MKENVLNKSLKKIAIFTICMTAFFFGLGCILAYIFSTTLNHATEERIYEEVSNYKEGIKSQIQRKFELLNTVSGLIGDSNLAETASFWQTFQVAASENGFLTFGYSDTKGKGIISVIGDKKVYDVSYPEIKPELGQVIEQAVKGEQVIVDIFMKKLSEQRLFVFCVPVYHEEKIVGALIASDTVDVFSEYFKEQRVFYGSGNIHLVDSEGKFIIRADEAIVKEEKISVLEPPYMSEEEAAVVKSSMARKAPVSFSFRYEKKKYDALLEPLEVNGWYLFCVNSLENVNRNSYAILYAAAAFYILTILLFFITMGVGYKRTRQAIGNFRKMAYYDELTGIYNMRRFTELAQEAAKDRRDYAIAALNVRQFKFVNELFRKEQADKLLKYIGQILTESLREGEYTCRESGDSFYLFLRETDRERLKERLNTICKTISDGEEITYRGYRVLMRCGAATSDTGEALQDVMINAMFALAKTRENQNTDMWFFDAAPHEREQLNNYIENHAQEAIEKEEFKLYLQPKMNLSDDSLAGAEALVRWVKSDGNFLYPGAFIPLFEKNGFCTVLDMYMFDKVCWQLRSWMDAGYEPVPISINQSKLTFYEENYEERLCGYLKKYDVPASLITLEILEGFTIKNVEKMNKRLEKLQEIGFQISMDDFGTGYSSLNTLGKLKIDEVKLDQGFLMEAMEEGGENTRLIMEEIIRLSKKLSISTVIEGIETEQNAEFVKKIGCDRGQGYLYSKPVSAEIFTSFILLSDTM